MGRNQRDEPIHAAITDSSDTSATDQKAPVNHLIDAMETAGYVVHS